jgi:hypothetical protein
MSAGWMLVVAAIVALLPIVLMIAFNGDDIADSRGRRVFHRWHT